MCNGLGWVHPLDSLGNISYANVNHCTENGCMADSYRAYRNGTPFIRSRGVIQNRTFDDFVKRKGTEEAFKHSKALANGDAPFIWLLIYGGTGNGKTHLCYAITQRLLERGVEAEMIASAELFSKIRQGIESHTSDEAMQHYKDVYALILDDWGVGYGTDFERARFDEIMASRYENYRVTVLTTNKDITEIPERVASRFQDKARAKVCWNKADDYRKVSR